MTAAATGDETMNAATTEQENVVPGPPTERRATTEQETIAPDSPTERNIRSRTLLEEVEENLAQSLLVRPGNENDYSEDVYTNLFVFRTFHRCF
jgi:hypothetical protein